MQGTVPRYLTLAGILFVGALLRPALAIDAVAGSARWPAADEVFSVSGWSVGPEIVEPAGDVHIISRGFVRPDGAMATLVLSTSPTAKAVYRAGAEIPFLGSGYTVDSAPPDLRASAAPRALVVHQADERYLLLYAYGERRGLLGNGLLAWGLVTLDAILGRSNDYFFARIITPLDSSARFDASEEVGLAEALFPRLAAWYAD